MRKLKQACLPFISFLFLGIFILSEMYSSLFADQKTLVFSTWEGFEADKCASIWLIKRFIDKNAIIKFFPKGEFINEGIPFDTPDAKLRRYQNMSTYESILKYYNLQDPKLVYIGKIMHDIEVNIWEKKIFLETNNIQNEIQNIIMDSRNNNEVIERSCKYFDSFYQGIKQLQPDS